MGKATGSFLLIDNFPHGDDKQNKQSRSLQHFLDGADEAVVIPVQDWMRANGKSVLSDSISACKHGSACGTEEVSQKARQAADNSLDAWHGVLAWAEQTLSLCTASTANGYRNLAD